MAVIVALAVLPAVHCFAAFAVELDCSCFLGCCAEVAFAVGKASEFGAVPVVVV